MLRGAIKNNFTISNQPLKSKLTRVLRWHLSIKRTNKDGSKVWRAVIRLKGHPAVCQHEERKQVVEDWARRTEPEIKEGRYKINKRKENILKDLIDFYGCPVDSSEKRNEG